MRSRPWDRNVVLADLSQRIWLHLTASATPHRIRLDAAALLRLPFSDVARLGHLHFVLDPRVSAFLDAAPALLRRPASDTTPVTEIAHDRIRGPVNWPATHRVRALTHEPRVVTHPRVRDADVQPNRLLALLLGEIRDRASSFGSWAKRTGDASIGARIGDVGRRAAALAAHRALRDVTPARPTDRERAALGGPRLGRRYAAALAAHEAHRSLVQHADAAAIRRSVEQYGFAASSDGTLFELLVVFGIRDALNGLGYALTPMRLFGGALRFTAVRGDDRVDAHYQSLPPEWTRCSRYRAAQHAHDLPHVHDLRPDLVLRITRAGQAPWWLAVEAKTTIGTGRVPELARLALSDLLAYRAAFDDELGGQRRWGLGVVWGEGMAPADHPISVCTPDHLNDAVADLIGV